MMTSLILMAAMTGQAKPSALAPKPAAKPAAPAARPAPAAPARPYVSLADKRRMKKDAAYRARLRREAAEDAAAAKAIEQARKDYKEALPYLLEVRRQNLAREGVHDLADAERAKAAAIARAAGYATGAPPAPPRIVNLPGAPYAP